MTVGSRMTFPPKAFLSASHCSQAFVWDDGGLTLAGIACILGRYEDTCVRTILRA